MKFLGIFLIVSAFVGITLAAVSIGNYSHPDHPGKCVKNDVVYEPGKHYPEGKCVTYHCAQNGILRTTGCGVEIILSPCILGDYVDRTAQHPLCCKRKPAICPDQHDDSDDYQVD